MRPRSHPLARGLLGAVLLAVLGAALWLDSSAERASPRTIAPIDAMRPETQVSGATRLESAPPPAPGRSRAERAADAGQIAPPTPEDDRTGFFLRVTDALDGRVLAGATAITCYPLSHAAYRMADPEARSDDRGLLAVKQGEPARSLVRVDHPGYVYAVAAFEPGHETPGTALELSLARAASLDLLVIGPEGEPKADVVVELVARVDDFAPDWADGRLEAPGWRRRTDANGRALLNDVPAGMALRASMRLESDVRDVVAPVTLAAGEWRTETWSWDAECAIEGLVVDAGGVPCPEFPVRLFHGVTFPAAGGSGRALVEKRSDADGRFRIEHLTPGTWWLASGWASGLTPRTEHDLPEPARVEIAPGDGTVRVTLEVLAMVEGSAGAQGLRRPLDSSATRIVHVESLDGSPAPSAIVLAHAPNDGRQRVAIGPSPVVLEGLPEGDTTILASNGVDAVSRPVPVLVEAGSTAELTLRLEPCAFLVLKRGYVALSLFQEGRRVQVVPTELGPAPRILVPPGVVEIRPALDSPVEHEAQPPVRIRIAAGEERVVQW